jgi:hypothetical protein
MRLPTMPKRFTIRTLIFATFLVALFFALPFRKARMQMEGREWVAAQRGHISFQYAVNRPTGRYSIPFVPDFLVDWFGVDMFNPVRGVCLDCDTIKDFGPVSKLSGLESIGINIDMADDIDFSPLKTLPRLKEIHFTQLSGLTQEQFTELCKFLPDVKVYSETHSNG